MTSIFTGNSLLTTILTLIVHCISLKVYSKFLIELESIEILIPSQPNTYKQVTLLTPPTQYKFDENG